MPYIPWFLSLEDVVFGLVSTGSSQSFSSPSPHAVFIPPDCWKARQEGEIISVLWSGSIVSLRFCVRVYQCLVIRLVRGVKTEIQDVFEGFTAGEIIVTWLPPGGQIYVAQQLV
ncbi:hypothetical protein PAAG_12412 [Paracoccidioides lutzii Pb01]|uniref:Uncharacterized protein n=1 Tax=Paracoccidioides lutzii (strain ATCC MYA-826 / Pb01) TaxID=502779 RepID=A0A0A2VJ16_PARBA|nr:hypothetical protein PAAG_12412 [Paracoccidioides lutzii Pb01]KGQ00909.1 hypothetical protein PAAG_12412 [Paracoccidioides lutzii Pb01]